ncbi:MAG: hypothetical protein DMG32_13080 [Acidobacteria bacterium]|nr:MAG: hypothetical protein DMG32_13080 [Acidobacteriota bacterium]
MKKRKDGWKHVIYKDKVPSVYFGRIGLGMDFCEEMTGVGGAGVKLLAFRQVASNRKLRVRFPICSKGSRSYNWGPVLVQNDW